MLTAIYSKELRQRFTLLFSELHSYHIDFTAQSLVAALFALSEKGTATLRICLERGSDIPQSLWSFARTFRSSKVNPEIDFLTQNLETFRQPLEILEGETLVVMQPALFTEILHFCPSSQVLWNCDSQLCLKHFEDQLQQLTFDQRRSLRFLIQDREDVQQLLQRYKIPESHFLVWDIRNLSTFQSVFQGSEFCTSDLERFLTSAS